MAIRALWGKKARPSHRGEGVCVCTCVHVCVYVFFSNLKYTYALK